MLLACLASAGGVQAQQAQNPEKASEVYNQGVEAYDREQYVEAARLFAKADEIAPNNTALQAAIEAAVLGDDAVLAMTLVDRTRARPPHPAAQEAAAKAKAKFGGTTGQIVVRCSGPVRCSVLADEQPISPEQPTWMLVGTHTLVVSFDEKEVTRTVEVEQGAKKVVEFEPPAEETSAAAPTSTATGATQPQPIDQPPETASGWDSTWFWVGAGLTAAFAGASIWSAQDLASKHDDFTSDGCDRFGGDGCEDAASNGKNAQLRTNLLLGATALAGAATLTIVLIPSTDGGQESSTSLMPVITARGTF